LPGANETLKHKQHSRILFIFQKHARQSFHRQ
jgi:hypothetical protein